MHACSKTGEGVKPSLFSCIRRVEIREFAGYYTNAMSKPTSQALDLPLGEPTERQRKAIDAETARRDKLPRGWHVIRELHIPNKRKARARWTYFVTFYKAKGCDTEECVTMKTQRGAESLACMLNDTGAVPTWMR